MNIENVHTILNSRTQLQIITTILFFHFLFQFLFHSCNKFELPEVVPAMDVSLMELYNNILCYDKTQECSKITLKGQMREGWGETRASSVNTGKRQSDNSQCRNPDLNPSWLAVRMPALSSQKQVFLMTQLPVPSLLKLTLFHCCSPQLIQGKCEWTFPSPKFKKHLA